MYREHLRNSNTAAIYDDIYENIGGGYKHLYSPAQLSRGTVPSCRPPPVSLRPWPQCFPKFGGSLLSMTKCLKYNRIVAGHTVAAARLQLFREVICCLLPLRASGAGYMRAISWWPLAYSLLCRRALGALSDDAV